MKQYREFQNRQVQSLLELREAQADVEAERRLEYLRQVRSMAAREPGMLPCSDISLLVLTGCLCPQTQQRLREIVVEAHTAQFKRLKEMNDR